MSIKVGIKNTIQKMGCCSSTLKNNAVQIDDISVPLLKLALSEEADNVPAKEADTSLVKKTDTSLVKEKIMRKIYLSNSKVLYVETGVNLSKEDTKEILRGIYWNTCSEFSGVQKNQ